MVVQGFQMTSRSGACRRRLVTSRGRESWGWEPVDTALYSSQIAARRHGFKLSRPAFQRWTGMTDMTVGQTAVQPSDSGLTWSPVGLMTAPAPRWSA